MSNSGRWRIVVPAALGLILAVASCGTAETQSPYARPQGFPEISLPRWNATNYLAETGYNRNDAQPGTIAIDHDGQRLAFTVPGVPSAGLVVLDVASGDALLLNNSVRAVEYVEPSFARDGQSIVFIATPVPRFGWTEIWIASSSGAYLRRLRSCTAMARAPQFAPNGKKVGYFGSLLTSDSTKWRFPVWPEQRSELPVIPYAIFEHDLEASQERQISQLVYSVPRWLDYASDSNMVISATSLLGRANQALLGRENEAWIPNGGATPFDGLKDGAGLRKRTEQGLVLLHVNRANPDIASSDAIGVRPGETLAFTPGGIPVGLEAVVGSLPSRPFEYIYRRLDVPERSVLFDTRAAPTFLFGPQQPASFSGNLCLVAHWSEATDGQAVTVISRCGPSAGQQRTFVVSELVRNARTKTSPWSFGDACRV